MIDRITKITLYVNNQEEAKEFWVERMHFVVKMEQPMGPGLKWLEVGPSMEEFTTFILYDKNLMHTQNPMTDTGHPSVILSTADISAAYNQLKANGVTTSEIMSMPYGKMLTFKDQDDNDYMLREDK
jgi:predicted enzyme related to lactoylglutathione lyase